MREWVASILLKNEGYEITTSKKFSFKDLKKYIEKEKEKGVKFSSINKTALLIVYATLCIKPVAGQSIKKIQIKEVKQIR